MAMEIKTVQRDPVDDDIIQKLFKQAKANSAGLVLPGNLPKWAPPWAHAADEDEFGHWASFDINGIEFKWRRVMPGQYLMGSPEDEPDRRENEGPQHLNYMVEEQWVLDAPLTQAQWVAVMGADNCPAKFAYRPFNPMENINIEDINGYLQELHKAYPLVAARLLSETEWEYMARAGTHGPRYSDRPLEELAWYAANSNGSTQPVKQLLPNPWGLYDVLGNVWEWCLDGAANFDELPPYPTGPVMYVSPHLEEEVKPHVFEQNGKQFIDDSVFKEFMERAGLSVPAPAKAASTPSVQTKIETSESPSTGKGGKVTKKRSRKTKKTTAKTASSPVTAAKK